MWDELRANHAAAGSFGQGVSSVQGSVSGNVAGSVASVAGNVAGDVVGSVGSIAAGASPPPHLRRTLFRRRPFPSKRPKRWRMRYSIETWPVEARVIHVTSGTRCAVYGTA